MIHKEQFKIISAEKDTSSKYLDNPLIENKRPNIDDFKNDLDYQEGKNKLKKAEDKIKEEWGRRIYNLGNQKAKELEESEKRSKIFEGFLTLEGKQIFGEDVEVVPASRFDDIFNKIDLVLEVKAPDKVIHLGIDVSVSGDPKVITDKTELTNQNRIKVSKASIRYFKSIANPGLKGKLENLPRIAFIISKEQWPIVLDVMRGSKDNTIDLKSIFLSQSLPQLENQFLLAISRNVLEIDIINKTKGLRPRKIHKDVVENLYNQARVIKNGNWHEMQKILKFFKENEKIFKLESIMTSHNFEFIRNIKDTLMWVYQQKKATEIYMFEIFGGEAKEKAAQINRAAIGQIGHWNSNVFEGL